MNRISISLWYVWMYYLEVCISCMYFCEVFILLCLWIFHYACFWVFFHCLFVCICICCLGMPWVLKWWFHLYENCLLVCIWNLFFVAIDVCCLLVFFCAFMNLFFTCIFVCLWISSSCVWIYSLVVCLFYLYSLYVYECLLHVCMNMFFATF